MHLGTRSLTLTVDGISRTSDVSDCRIVSGALEESKRRLCEPGRAYRLQGTAVQDPVSGSLWDLVWDRVGQQVEVDLRPAGGLMPSNEQPWFVGTITIAEPDGDLLGGGADTSPTSRFTFEFDWPFTARPTRLVA